MLQTAAFGGVTLSGPARAPSVLAETSQPRAGNAFDYKRNWGRWGKDNQKGAVNLITPAKRASAAALVKSGRAVSLAHAFTPPQHYFRVNQRGTGQSFVDYMGFEYHGVTVTHVDALCATCGTAMACGTAGIPRRRLAREGRIGVTSLSSEMA